MQMMPDETVAASKPRCRPPHRLHRDHVALGPTRWPEEQASAAILYPGGLAMISRLVYLGEKTFHLRWCDVGCIDSRRGDGGRLDHLALRRSAAMSSSSAVRRRGGRPAMAMSASSNARPWNLILIAAGYSYQVRLAEMRRRAGEGAAQPEPVGIRHP